MFLTQILLKSLSVLAYLRLTVHSASLRYVIDFFHISTVMESVMRQKLEGFVAAIEEVVRMGMLTQSWKRWRFTFVGPLLTYPEWKIDSSPTGSMAHPLVLSCSQSVQDAE